MTGKQFENGQPPTGEVLLMPQVLVANDEQLEARRLGFAEQVAIFQFTPALPTAVCTSWPGNA